MSGFGETLEEASWVGDVASAIDHKNDSGLTALIAIAKHYDIAANAGQIWHVHGKTDSYYGDHDIIRCALQIGLKAQVIIRQGKQKLTAVTPFLVTTKEDGSYYLVSRTSPGGLEITHPITGEVNFVKSQDIDDRLMPELILFGKNPAWQKTKAEFGFSWFFPSVLKHMSRFRRVLIASLIIQVFALATPKLFEVVIDRVLVSRGLLSLDILAIGLLGIAFFDPLMTFIRSILFAHIASCVNSELSAKLFRHLVYLPLEYFRSRQAGDIIARVRELDHIRNFLTGPALMMIVDLVFVGVFLAFMYAYASQLTYIVMATLAIFGIFWLCVGPFLRRRVETQYERNADNTAFLTESVTGVETIKSLGMGGRFSNEWEEKLGASLRASFRASMFGHWAGGGIGLVQKFSSAMVLWFGVGLVLEGELTVGQLIAFNMLASHVTMPILRLAQMWQDFQHTSISIRRIGDILNEKTETVISAGRSSLEQVEGEVELRKVSFRYSDDGPEVLRRLDLKLEAGEVLGITGLSGSGKSTITKLMQRFYVPQSGQILIDNVDLAMADPAMLRRRMGVVLQENFLFNGTIHDNIVLGNPTASIEAIERAAFLSGTDEFVDQLPDKYDTQVGERGNRLSGGQRQRVAIARALLSDPSILIFDEATSALDYETEAAILKRLPEIVKGRTVIMIAHRLNCMSYCNHIAVMDKGEIIEKGTHKELLNAKGQYSKLWNLQNSSNR